MCQVVYTQSGKEIETPREFKEFFGFEADMDKHYKTVDPDSCLCQCDLDLTFKNHNIPYIIEAGDYCVNDNYQN